MRYYSTKDLTEALEAHYQATVELLAAEKDGNPHLIAHWRAKVEEAKAHLDHVRANDAALAI